MLTGPLSSVHAILIILIQIKIFFRIYGIGRSREKRDSEEINSVNSYLVGHEYWEEFK